MVVENAFLYFLKVVLTSDYSLRDSFVKPGYDIFLILNKMLIRKFIFFIK